MVRSLLLLALVLLPVAARAQTAPATPAAPAAADSLVGAWSYAVETPDGAITGRLLIAKAEDGTLSARLTGGAGEQSLDVRDFTFDGARITGRFTNPQFGTVSFDLAVSGRTLTGSFTAVDMGATVPASGRKVR